MTCIKTGARVFLMEYNQTLAADIFAVNDCLVFRFNMSTFDTESSHWGSDGATHVVNIGTNDNQYWNKGEGTLVVPRSYCIVLAED